LNDVVNFRDRTPGLLIPTHGMKPRWMGHPEVSGWVEEGQKQIPPLCCGMEMQKDCGMEMPEGNSNVEEYSEVC